MGGSSSSLSYDALPDLKGKVVIVTGAAAGLGKETSRVLASKGAHVIMCGRNQEKTAAAIEEVKQLTGNPNVEFGKVDLSSFASVNAFSDEFLERKLPLHVLINNAGVYSTPYSIGPEGIENQFQSNHFGHVVLTHRLLPALAASQPSRVVVVSSESHDRDAPSDGIHYDDLNDEKKYSATKRYGETKLANVHFAVELQRRLSAAGGFDRIYVNAVHPGKVNTDISLGSVFGRAAKLVTVFFMPVSQGAYTQVYCAAHPDIEKNNIKGQYFVPFAKQQAPSALGSNPELQARTWDWTNRILVEKLGDKFKPFV